MRISTSFAVLALIMASPAGNATAQEPCAAPAPVCAAGDAVFVVSAFEPFASAVRIAPDLLVTNRHVVADHDTVRVRRADGSVVTGSVIPSAYDGDLALIESLDLGEGPILAEWATATPDTVLYTVAGDHDLGRIRAYDPGSLIIAPAADATRPRLHHDAHSQPGNSGGALVDPQGRLIGIVASGGEGRFEAMPSADIALLIGASGPDHEAADAEMGAATRICVETLERAQAPLDAETETNILETCVLSANRQLLDLAAQALARARHFENAEILLTTALGRDPHALNTRLSLVITYLFMQRFENAQPHLEFLLEHLGNDAEVLRMAIQVSARTGNDALTDKALALIERHHPDLIDWADRLLQAVR